MALKVRQIATNRQGQRRSVDFEIDFDSTYPSGGEPLDTGRPEIDIINPESILFEPQAGYEFRYNRTSKKVMAYTAGSQASGDLSALVNVRGKATGE